LPVLTLHHWEDLGAGLAELRRVAARQVVFLFEPLEVRRFWAVEYFPEAVDVPSERRAPGVQQLRDALEVQEVRVVPIPIDCTDGFGAAYWGRPEAYLDPAVQASQSWLAQLDERDRSAGATRLSDDLASGGGTSASATSGTSTSSTSATASSSPATADRRAARAPGGAVGSRVQR
jgi:hypothetical protein